MPGGSCDYLFKVVIVGDSRVGKSCFLAQFTDKGFTANYDITTDAMLGVRKIQLDGVNIRLQIWDIPGSLYFDGITRAYNGDVAGCVLMYDVTNGRSFDHIAGWLNNIRGRQDSNKTIILVANKSDLDDAARVVTKEEGEQFARDNGLLFIETSATNLAGVEEAFNRLATNIHEKIQKGVESAPAFSAWAAAAAYFAKSGGRGFGNPLTSIKIAAMSDDDARQFLLKKAGGAADSGSASNRVVAKYQLKR